MQKLVNKIINESVKDADIYKTDGGSTWLIFTDNKQWVIELTESKTLWYNYNFFKNIFNYVSMDVVGNQHYITKWVEDNIINDVNETHYDVYHHKDRIDNIVKNSVNETKYNQTLQGVKFKKVLNNEIIMSNPRQYVTNKIIDDTIETGVKETELHKGNRRFATNYAIKRGIKETKTPGDGDIVSTIEWMDENKSNSVPKMINDVIENGVKETIVCNYKDPKTNLLYIKWDVEIDRVVETGIKEVQPLPSQEGNKDWGIYYHGKEDRTKPHTEYVDEAIKTGIKYE